MNARVEKAQSMNCDGIEPDNMDGESASHCDVNKT